MKAIVLLNGEPYKGKIDDSNAYVYCCDGAYDWAKGRVRIDETLGDFDSLNYIPDPRPKEIFPTEKDMTDGEIALYRAIDAGAEVIEIYGGGGKREDHFLGNLHLLYAALKRGVQAFLFTNYAVISVFEGACNLCYGKGTTVSIVPFGGDAHMIKSSGFYYPMNDLWLRYGSTRGISNVIDEGEATFFSEGTVLVIVNKEVS